LQSGVDPPKSSLKRRTLIRVEFGSLLFKTELQSGVDPPKSSLNKENKEDFERVEFGSLLFKEG
jgi:hypothetical protein